ncbi:MAG: hypothetical protein DCF25_22465 [Leptolyngbya foveolarum]|uniref:Riboflavin kinase domain-containing protein n=1 Tax=Leptolyngbya foveolarum TaxID=47253 RepID=A0A2W4TM26_9CYAN|nr:MAG: hypothetical protein DCF25_22465 [Leptolyngbya foveolarum]
MCHPFRQTPHFLAQGIDLSPFYSGTLNVSIDPYRFELIPQRTLSLVKWSPEHEPESFSFVPIQLEWQRQCYSGLVYYPHLETKIDHFQEPTVIELLMPCIDAIAYGDEVILRASNNELIIKS